MRSFLAIGALIIHFGFVGCSSKPAAVPERRHAVDVALPVGDPLMHAIDQRFGRPDRVTGSGRAFLQYDLSNGDTVTLVVSGDRIIGLQHDKRSK